MAKRNSTKTATKEALQASEPRIQVFKQWNGVNIKEAPIGWNHESEDDNQTDLPMNFLTVQNNVDTTAAKALEVRKAELCYADAVEDMEFTGVICLWGENLYAAMRKGEAESIWVKKLGDKLNDWVQVTTSDPDDTSSPKWTSIEHFQTALIGLTEEGVMFTGFKDELSDDFVTEISAAKYIDTPTTAPKLEPKGSLSQTSAGADDAITRIRVQYTFSNKYGQTLPCAKTTTIWVNSSPVEWHSGCYLRISGDIPEADRGYITGVDIYYSLDENLDSVFGGHVEVSQSDTAWVYNWLGAMADTSVWTSVPLTVPTENTTRGVPARYCNSHDGRLYFWGNKEMPYRLYIGGNPGSELSVSRGLGGAFVDIDPGSDTEIHGTAKFKTYNGSSIVTIMCGNPNTGSVKRFNLLETNVTLTNELSAKGYMYEEVSNVIGCNSRYGFGVWEDGLYAVSRYGLAVTTQVMESNNQLRATFVSDPVQPVFTEKLSNRLKNCHMVCIDGIIYICLGEESGDDLDNVILCYDITLKAWWTFTLAGDSSIKHIFNMDSENHWEGIGVVRPSRIDIVPLTGSYRTQLKAPHTIIQTGELCARQPVQSTHYLCQLEFRFDYFVGDVTIRLDGIDHYGRQVRIVKVARSSEMLYDYAVWLRVDKLLENYHLTVESDDSRSNAYYRLTHINAKVYTQSNKIGIVYGYDDRSVYRTQHGRQGIDHHAVKSYNNLREAIIT